MRVWMFTHRLPFAPNRGDRIRAYHILEGLRQRAEVHLFSLVHDDEELAAADTMRDRVASLHTARVPVWRNRCRAVPRLLTEEPLTTMLLDAPHLHQAARRLRDSARPDVTLAYCSSMVPFSTTPALAGVPFVLDMVDVDSEKWRALSKISAPHKRLIYRREATLLSRFEQRAIRAAQATLTVNEREAVPLRRLVPGATIRSISNGIALETFAPQPAPSAVPTVVFCGVLNYAPNEDAAIRLCRDIWPAVRARITAARLVLLGAYPTTRLLSLAAGDQTVTVTGTVDDVRPYLWEASVSVAPLSVARGLQNKVLEALAAGLPVVTSPVVAEGLPPGLTGSGVSVAQSDAQFVESICRLLSQSPDDRRRLALSTDLSALTWERQLRPLWPILEEACHSNRQAAASRTRLTV